MTIRLPEKFSPFGKFMLGALLVSVLCLAVPALASAAWTVDSTGDQPDQTLKNGVCKTAANTCTLRAAIEESNAEGNTQEIFFGNAFNGKAGSIIVLGSALPAFHPERGEINGISAGACTTTSGVSGPCVEIDGPAGAKTLVVSATGEATVKGLDLTGGEIGLEAIAGAAQHIEENWIGKKLDGTAAPASNTGIVATGEPSITGNSIVGGQIGIHTSGGNPNVKGIRQNAITGAAGAGILIENSFSAIYGNQISKSGVGVRIHEVTGVAAEENVIGGLNPNPGSADPDANTITGSTGAAIEVNTAASTTTTVLRNSGSGNGGPFISLVKKSAAEPKGPNEGLQPPVITTATATSASGTAKPESFVRVYANSTGSPGEMGTFLGLTEAAPVTGAWSLTYTSTSAPFLAASQTVEETEGGSSALAFTWIGLKVQKAGTGSGTVTSTPTGINCGTTCEMGYAKGTLVKLLGVPAAGSLAVSWTGCDLVNGAGECEVTLSAAKSVTATFALPSTGGGSSGGGSSGGGSGGGGGSTPTPTPTPIPTKPAPAKKPLKCKAGFKKKTVKGNARCVKVKKGHKKHR